MDILCCEVQCQGMPQVEAAWHTLKEHTRSEDITPFHIRLVAVRDGFVVCNGRRCCEVVVSLQGYLATVRLVEVSVAQLEKDLDGVCSLAEQIGLLDDVKQEKWGSLAKPLKPPDPPEPLSTEDCRLTSTALLRVLALAASGMLSSKVPLQVAYMDLCLLKLIVGVTVLFCFLGSVLQGC